MSGMIALADELQSLDITNKVILLGPSVHVICHLIGTEVRYQKFFITHREFATS